MNANQSTNEITQMFMELLAKKFPPQKTPFGHMRINAHKVADYFKIPYLEAQQLIDGNIFVYAPIDRILDLLSEYEPSQ